jgi:hypothetical protein
MSLLYIDADALSDESITNTDSGDADSIEGDYSPDIKGWRDILDHVLVEWARDHSALDDTDFDSPSDQVIAAACQFAQNFRDNGLPSPTRVVPDGDGGICFEWCAGCLSVSLEISETLSVEMLQFRNNRLIDRQQM